jgi:hypothetical protein
MSKPEPLRKGDRVVYVGPDARRGVSPLMLIGETGTVSGVLPGNPPAYQVRWSNVRDASMVPAEELELLERGAET